MIEETRDKYVETFDQMIECSPGARVGQIHQEVAAQLQQLHTLLSINSIECDSDGQGPRERR
jgi:hypothetical protein